MEIVLDANIVISALLGSKQILQIILSGSHNFYAPERIVQEIKKHEAKICKIKKCTKQEFDEQLESLLIYIRVVEKPLFEKYTEQAKAMEKRDPTDMDYLACAISINADIIWSNDPDFDSQNIVKNKTTKQLIEEGKT